MVASKSLGGKEDGGLCIGIYRRQIILWRNMKLD